MKMGKATSLLLLSTMTTILISGCASDKAEDKPAASNGATPATIASQGPVTIDYLAHNSYAQIADGANNPIQKLVEQKFNAKFNIWYLDAQNREESLNVKLASGEMPDIMSVVGTLKKLIDQNVAAPIDEALVRKYAPTYAKFIDDNYKQAWDFGKYNGKLYALPSTNINSSYPTAVIWRDDWLKKVGITKMPETIQEVEQALTKFRNDDPDGNGKKDTYGMSDFAIPAIMGAFGRPAWDDIKAGVKEPVKAVVPMIKDGKVVVAGIQPEMKDALALLQKWYKAGLIDPEFLTSENTTGYWANSQAFFNNRIGLTGKGLFAHWRNEVDPSNPNDQGGGQFIEFKKSQPNGTYAFGSAPVGPQGKSGTPQWQSFSNSILFTTKGVKDPRKVETLLRMIETNYADNDYWLTITQGIKDKDWKVDNGNFMNLDGDTKTPAEVKGRFIFNVGQSPDNWMKKKDTFLYKYADKTKVKGYEPVPMPSVDAFSKNANTLGKMEVEAYIKIITGESSVDSFDDFVSKFRSSGGDQVEREWTDAYNKMLGK
ncbi:ABC transporter substrate-binding protein [Paenibacillus oryzisoli]|uniref:extracellular solute-binding protein n=1 Tax=Paenibacillus oryzisoli TaxID=1850517 RepID=UPI003D28ADAB